MSRKYSGFLDYVVGAALVIAVLALITFGVWLRAEAPCSWWSWASVKDVPARCLMHR